MKKYYFYSAELFMVNQITYGSKSVFSTLINNRISIRNVHLWLESFIGIRGIRTCPFRKDLSLAVSRLTPRSYTRVQKPFLFNENLF